MPQLHGKFAILRQILQPIKPIFLSLMLFSMVLNVLMLAPSIYMLQVYDRVLSSQNQFTLFAITLIVLWCIWRLVYLNGFALIIIKTKC
jgi:ABC-type protease/lipase transport system fused ATPase/permease subunit